MAKKIILAGGSGFIGQRLTQLLLKNGHKVAWLSRNPSNKTTPCFFWDPSKGKIDAAALEGVDAVINLAGSGIAEKRWTIERKKDIIDSRVQSAQTLEKAILAARNKPKTYIAASAIGFYGNRGEELLKETDKPGSGFLTQSTLEWEKATETLHQHTQIRTVQLRVGIVLGKEGGALQEIERPIRFGIGAYFGDGRAWYSWIHLDDICRMFIWALEQEELSGTFNAVAPTPVRNIALVQAIRKAMGKIAIPAPAPSFVMRLILGEMAAVVLNSTNVSAEKVVDAGFSFTYPEIQGALEDIYRE